MLAVFAATALAQERVSETVHNLSLSGPGRIRATTEQQVCIFCHAPHNTGGVRPLWNRESPTASYRIYQSSTLDAKPGQPTGSSKLCLSCHDGTIALGRVLSRADQIRMSGGDFIPSGLTNLGTDLSDDHPISFHYTAGLAASDRQLLSPAALPSQIRLDPEGQLQCTSCHDAHNNKLGDFLVLSDAMGALCTACHRMTGWESSSHRLSGISVSGAVGVDWPYATVAENACRSCHRAHTAGGHERLLIHEEEEKNCLNCHSGQVARTNIRAQLDKPSAHDPRLYQGIHDPVETPGIRRPHVECADCHNPHAGSATTPQTAYVPIGPTMVNVTGVTAAGAPIQDARHEYEVCFKCHGDSAVTVDRQIQRQAQTSNLRLKFSPNNASFHPVVVPSPSRDTVSLVPGLSQGSLIRCTDCHNNEAGPRAGGNGPDGPHGSIYDFLLERNYTVRDDNVESEFEYAMCYKCHQRSIILSDRSFPHHRLHIVDQRTPCSICHDAHGISSTQSFGSDHTHLINFDTRYVRPNAQTGRIEFRDEGTLSGSCTLSCHGVEHNNTAYGLSAAGAPPAPAGTPGATPDARQRRMRPLRRR
jgi:predicted CXXCH cytochrome family protein